MSGMTGANVTLNGEPQRHKGHEGNTKGKRGSRRSGPHPSFVSPLCSLCLCGSLADLDDALAEKATEDLVRLHPRHAGDVEDILEAQHPVDAREEEAGAVVERLAGDLVERHGD